MYGIDKKVYKNLISYFQSNSDIQKVIIFGSRAKGTENINSDIDLCIGYTGKSKGTIVAEIDDVIGVYSCDIVFSDSLNENIGKQIDRDGIEIYCRKPVCIGK
jgi:predicted nucleotidyltransferase